MEYLYKVLLAVTGYILSFGLISNLIRNYLNFADPLAATLYGILIGPKISDPLTSLYVLFIFSRIVLSLQIMTISLQLPTNYVYKKLKSLIVLLIPGSLFSAVITFSLVYFLLDYDLNISWIIAASCTPTDPIISSSIMRGDFANAQFPERIRLLLAAESGLNDGIGIIFLYLIFLKDWSFKKYLWEAIVIKVLLAAITGYLTGLVFGFLLKFCHSKRFVGRSSITVFGIALSLFCMSLSVYLRQSELIYIFFTGIAFSKSEWFVLETRGSQFQLLVESIFNITFFIYLGARVEWNLISWKIFLVSCAILVLRRPVSLLMVYKYVPVIKTRKEALIVGWFGPIGVGSLYYSSLMDRLFKIDTVNFISFLVMISIFVHGLSVPIFLFVKYLLNLRK